MKRSEIFRTLGLIVAFIVLSGSASCERPTKPVVELCQLDSNLKIGLCGQTGQGADTESFIRDLPELDKATAFRPTEWKKIQDYINEQNIYIDKLEEKLSQ